MKLILGGILASLLLAGCSANQAGPTGPQGGGGGVPGMENLRDMCALVPGPDAAKALGVNKADAKKELDGACLYSGMAECKDLTPKECGATVEFRAGGWKDASPVGDAVDGVGEKGYYSAPMLKVKSGNDQLRIYVDRELSGGDAEKQKKQAVDLAKAVLAKL